MLLSRTNSFVSLQKVGSPSAAGPTQYYHSTTVSNAKAILSEGPKSNELYVTPSLFEARTYGATKSLGQMLTRHDGPYDARMCTLRLIPQEDSFSFYSPHSMVTPHGSLVSAPNPDLLKTVDMSTNGNHVFLTKNGFQKCYVEPVDPRALIEKSRCTGLC